MYYKRNGKIVRDTEEKVQSSNMISSGYPRTNYVGNIVERYGKSKTDWHKILLYLVVAVIVILIFVALWFMFKPKQKVMGYRFY